MQFFTPIIIGIAAVSGYILGHLWYLPFTFQKAWLLGEGKTVQDIVKRSRVYTFQVALYSLIAHGAIASVLALMFELLQVSSVKVALCVGALLTFGFIITVNFITMIYTVEGVHFNKRAQIKFLVSSGYYLFIVSIMSYTIFCLA
jgi:hypothetical protein